MRNMKPLIAGAARVAAFMLPIYVALYKTMYKVLRAVIIIINMRRQHQ